jgi:hypothetical protein
MVATFAPAIETRDSALSVLPSRKQFFLKVSKADMDWFIYSLLCDA